MNLKRVRHASAAAAASGVLLLLVGCATSSPPAYSVSAALLLHDAIAPSQSLTSSLPPAYQNHAVGTFSLPGSVEGVIAITPAGCALGTVVGRAAASVTVGFSTRESDPVVTVPQVLGGSKLGRASAVGMRNATVSFTLYCGLDGVGVIVHKPANALNVTGAVRPAGTSGQSHETALQVDG